MQSRTAFTDINIPLASKYARVVVLRGLMYWTPPPPDQTIGPPNLLDPPFKKSWTRP